METKICTRCCVEKPIGEFSWRNKKLNKKHSKCKECVAELDKQNYENNSARKEKIRKRAIEQYKFNKEFILRYKKLLKCSICGDDRHYVLDFHHERDKKYEISDIIRSGYSLKTIKDELRKCTPLCANCHREKHYLESCGSGVNGSSLV